MYAKVHALQNQNSFLTSIIEFDFFSYSDEMNIDSVGQSTMEAEWFINVNQYKLNDEFSIGFCWLTDPEN